VKRAPDTRWKRDALLGALPGVAWMAFMLVRGGFGAYWLRLVTQRIPSPAAVPNTGHRAARPRRGYPIALLVSAGLATLLRLVAPNPAAPIFWFALTAFGVFWAWYWERTEPLPKA